MPIHMYVADDVLDGYPLHIARLLPKRVGRRMPRDASRGERRRGRRTFLMYFPQAPWSCGFCGGAIWSTDLKENGLVVHHDNHDRTDNRLINLMPAHNFCHSSYHIKKKKRG
jgi:hypothetical protein